MRSAKANRFSSKLWMHSLKEKAQSAYHSDDLHRGGEIIPDGLLAHLAPVGWQHINLTGDYLWDADTDLAPDGFRQLRAAAAITAHAA